MRTVKDDLLAAKRRAEREPVIDGASGESFWLNAVAAARLQDFAGTQAALREIGRVRPLKRENETGGKRDGETGSELFPGLFVPAVAVVELDYGAYQAT
jgi:hypothetical protein